MRPLVAALVCWVVAACAPSDRGPLRGEAFILGQPKTLGACLEQVKRYYDAKARENLGPQGMLQSAYTYSDANIESEACRDRFDPKVRVTTYVKSVNPDGTARYDRVDSWKRQSEIRQEREEERKAAAGRPVPGSGIEQGYPVDTPAGPDGQKSQGLPPRPNPTKGYNYGDPGCIKSGALNSSC